MELNFVHAILQWFREQKGEEKKSSLNATCICCTLFDFVNARIHVYMVVFVTSKILHFIPTEHNIAVFSFLVAYLEIINNLLRCASAA